ncbi:MAG TPA: HyaD/HybD family hydrogenase maturation endopeptidase [Syntrophobacteraceae bacterium]|nr:HyaD/HybD family hydrogenase maturation endopeptidase [Syntrophobacteraceae bacterium]
MQHNRILVLGVGNILLRDEGVGVRAVVELQSNYDFSDNVELLDGGTLGMSLLGPICGSDYLIVVDAVRYGHPAGTLYRFTAEDFERRVRYKNSLHQLDLVEALAFAELLEKRPRAVVVGIEPEDMSPWGTELTETVQARLSDVCSRVLEEIALAGGTFKPRNGAPQEHPLAAARK